MTETQAQETIGLEGTVLKSVGRCGIRDSSGISVGDTWRICEYANVNLGKV